MGQAKLQKIGNSFGFRISKNDLEAAEFDESSEYEIIAEKGVIMLLKKQPHHTNWQFNNTKLSKEDHEWLNSKLTNKNE